MERNRKTRKGQNEYERTMVRVSGVSIVTNILLTGFKLVAGIAGHSAAMVADAVHSLSDVLGSGLVMAGAKLSAREADELHPYGHERLECIVSLILADILFLAGGGIGYRGIGDLRSPDQIAVPGMIALIAAVVSMITKEGLYHYTRIAARKTDSVSLLAEAWHHRSDALSSIGSFVGILGAILGMPRLQPLACIFIALMIFKVAIDICKDTVDRLIDRSCDAGELEQIRQVIQKQDGVFRIDDLKTRKFGARIFVDLEIACDGALSLYDAHAIAQIVHDAVEQSNEKIKHCTVHVNPASQGNTD